MVARQEIFKCEICGNIIEVLHGGKGELQCCNQPRKKMEEQKEDFVKEKHVPIITETEEGILVKVGSTDHPMEEDHYIEWIEVLNGDYVNRKHLKPGDKPEAPFYVKKSDKLIAREYCNKHGLWKD